MSGNDLQCMTAGMRKYATSPASENGLRIEELVFS
jgi:hypothetical protein